MRLMIFFGALILGLSWLLPGHYFPWLTFQQEATALIGALLIIAATWLPQRSRIYWPWLSVVVLAAACVPAVQFALGEIRFRSDALVASAYLTAFGLSIAAGATLVRERRIDISGAVLTALAAAGLISIGFAISQWQGNGVGLFIEGVRLGDRLYANFSQPNHFATALAMGIASLVLAFERHRIGVFVASLGVAVLGFGIVASQSRTGWLFVALLAVLLLAMRRRAHLRVSPTAVIVGSALFALAVVSWAPLNELLLMTDTARASDRWSTAGTRPIHWQVMWDAAWRRPWSGYGWTQAVLGQEAAALDHPFTGEVLNSSHNLLLDLVIWNGIPLGLVFIVALIAWFMRQLLICRDGERVGLLAAVAAVFLHGLLEFPLEYAFFLMPVGFLMGALDGGESAPKGFSLPSASIAIPSLALSALLAWVGVEYLKVDESARVMRFVAMGIGLNRVSSAPEPQVILLDRPRNLHRFMLAPARRSPDPDYMEWVRDVATRQPMAPAMLRHALAAGINGHADEARHVLALLCRMHSADRCLEGQASWHLLQEQYAELRDIAPPGLPPGAVSERCGVAGCIPGTFTPVQSGERALSSLR